MSAKTACLNIPTASSDYSVWKQWHIALKKCVGKKNANQLWVLNYDKEQPSDNVELRAYMRGQGVDLDRSIVDRGVDWGAGVYNWFSGALDVTSGLTIVILLIIVGGAGLLIFNIAKTTDADKAMRAGLAYGTAGMSEIGGPPKGLGGGNQKLIQG